MRRAELVGRRVGLLGYGREGAAALAALRRVGHDAPVHVYTDAPTALPEGAVGHAGDGAIDALAEVDVILRSPGFKPSHPLRRGADARGLLQLTSTNLFLAEVRAAGLPVVGITGSKGKSTTSTLTHLLLREAGLPSVLVGNIGHAALDELDRVLTERLLPVMELSSYQCADLEEGPSVALFLDLFPEHLDWHGSLDAYYGAKARIAATQRTTDRLRFNARSGEYLRPFVRAADAVPVNHASGLHFADGWFRDGDTPLLPDEGMRLLGLHNRQNAVAAYGVASLFGATPAHLGAVIRSFSGLPYRLQDEGFHQGIRWVNDSLSTAPEAAAAAIGALAPVATVIAGGQDRGYDPTPLVEAAIRHDVATLVLVPDTGATIAATARRLGFPGAVHEVPGLPEAVAVAKAATPAGATCLFSPGAPSYNRYRSFEERGAHLRGLIA